MQLFVFVLSLDIFFFFAFLFLHKKPRCETSAETCDKSPGPDLKGVAGLRFVPEPAESPGRPLCISPVFAL